MAVVMGRGSVTGVVMGVVTGVVMGVVMSEDSVMGVVTAEAV